MLRAVEAQQAALAELGAVGEAVGVLVEALAARHSGDLAVGKHRVPVVGQPCRAVRGAVASAAAEQRAAPACRRGVPYASLLSPHAW